MIGSFWNLCRACPSMPVDKLHSEYRSTYRWHEYTGGPEVIRKPPVPNQFGTANEPPLPRRKKCPELAYRTHEFISCDEPDKITANVNNRARSEERGNTQSRRSKSEGPPGSGRKIVPIPNGVAVNGVGEPNKKSSGQAGESSGLFKKTISKLSTEYRLQFVWPHVRRTRKGCGGNDNNSDDVVEPPKKSLSMGAIKSSQHNQNIPMVHKKRTTHEKEAAVHELEPLVRDLEDNKPHERMHYEKFVSDVERFGFTADKKQGNAEHRNDEKIILQNGSHNTGETWYKEVIELRKKAGEYKCRGWGIEIDPDLYKKQKDLWDQVSRRSSLSALSLASTVRPITKEEKEKENNKKSSPTKGVGKFPGQALPISGDNKRRSVVRHHLERTTGPDVEEGTILPSPTREKLMPAIPKSKEDDSYNSQRGSPKKSATSRHGSPQKGSPQKGSPQKSKGRSQSVGPGVAHNENSPKRQIRTGNNTTTNNNINNNTNIGGNATPAAPTSANKTHKKTPVSTPTGERRPRPTTLSTTSQTRSKSSSLPPHARAHSAPNHNNSINDQNKSSPSTLNIPNLRKTNNKPQQRPKSTILNGQSGLKIDSTTTIKFDDQPRIRTDQDINIIAEIDDTIADKEGGTSISAASPLPPQEITEHIIKSPPEPTRVKSPEQILMRSPDPVNWTVPLDTGKTFTVTQNVRDGDTINRPQSEFKVSTPVDKPPPAPMSAPPELAEQAKMEAWKTEQKPGELETSTTTSSSSITPNVNQQLSPQPPPPPSSDVSEKRVPGSTIRCLEDPSFDPEINSPSGSRNPSTTAATDVLEKARNRFDRFWGGSNTETPEEENV